MKPTAMYKKIVWIDCLNKLLKYKFLESSALFAWKNKNLKYHVFRDIPTAHEQENSPWNYGNSEIVPILNKELVVFIVYVAIEDI